jgi:TonB family protein
MLTRAFVLCSDEKALDAVSQVLGELEITFEQFHEIAFATKRLASQAFDFVVVDCDHQDNATLLFQSLRSSDLNRNAMTVAVVDGRTGVPIAFRLGAELVITKPVSLEQARSTMRTAVAMRRKTHPEAKISAPPITPPAPTQAPAGTGTPKTTITFPELKPSDPKALEVSLTPRAAKATEPISRKEVAAPAKRGLSLSMPGQSNREDPAMPALALDSERATNSTAEKPGYPLSAETFQPKPVRRSVSSGLIGAFVLAVIAAGGYEAYNMVPQFRTTVDANYRLIRSRLPGAQPAVATAAPKPVKPVVRPAPAPAVPPDGFVASGENAAPTETESPASAKAAKPIILATTATTTTGDDLAAVTVPDDIADQHVSSRVDPVYPEALRRKGVHGYVVLQALVANDGSVNSVSVVSGNPQLAAAAMDAVKQWKYQTYLHNGTPTAFQTNVTVAFEAAPKSAH